MCIFSSASPDFKYVRWILDAKYQIGPLNALSYQSLVPGSTNINNSILQVQTQISSHCRQVQSQA